MRQSIKPFVVERRKKWQPKREGRPLFTQEELLNAAEPEVPPDVPLTARSHPREALPPPAPPPRILPDLTPPPAELQPSAAVREKGDKHIPGAESAEAEPNSEVGLEGALNVHRNVEFDRGLL